MRTMNGAPRKTLFAHSRRYDQNLRCGSPTLIKPGMRIAVTANALTTAPKTIANAFEVRIATCAKDFGDQIKRKINSRYCMIDYIRGVRSGEYCEQKNLR
ncbi:MAG: hypothetical protein IH984_14265 [Planctomycetes bacterium]|nr:hypothetical protein [Planctomycetota bacterium]